MDYHLKIDHNRRVVSEPILNPNFHKMFGSREHVVVESAFPPDYFIGANIHYLELSVANTFNITYLNYTNIDHLVVNNIMYELILNNSSINHITVNRTIISALVNIESLPEIYNVEKIEDLIISY